MADSLHDHHRAVLEAMHRAGCAPSDPGVIVFDGRLHRFHVQDDKRGSRNGWFVLDDDGVPGGSFGSWRTGQPQTWRAEVREELTPEQRRRHERRIAEARARRREAQRALHERARVRAGELWARARPLVDARHPYLVNKHVPAIGLRQLGELLVVPARDGDGGLHSLEFINPEGVKRFLKDGVVEGHFHGLGDPRAARAILLCEGYATGASLHRASGLPVIVGFNRANLLPVARDARRRYPAAALVIAADDDRHTPGNPGRRDAQEAARWVGGAVILPDFTGLDRRSEPTDFNDLQVLGGVPRLQASLQTQLAAVLPGGAAPAPDNDPRPTVPGRQVGRLHHEDTAAREGEREPLPVAAMAAPRAGAARGGGRSGLYQEVTDRIVALIEDGTAPWQRPWDRPRLLHAPAFPVNAATGKPYHGINSLLLGADPRTADDPRWCGYAQARARGWQVRAGACGTAVYFFKRLELDDANDPDREPPLDEDGRPLRRTVPLLRRHTVFHASQIEGIPALEEVYGPADLLPDHRWDMEDRLEALLRRTGAPITHGGGLAYYDPREDRIHLPPRERFPNPAAYYGVAFHELGHWTGHETRLNRPYARRRDAPEYAREELRAELASAFLGAELGLQHDLADHAAYLDLYLDLLRQDNREIFRAARDAQHIADLILDRHPAWQLKDGVCARRTESPAAVATEAETAADRTPAAAPPTETGERATTATATEAPEPHREAAPAVRLLRIVAPRFCAGLLLRGEEVVEAAPILRRMVGSTETDVRRACAARGWTCEDLDDDHRHGEADPAPEPTGFRPPPAPPEAAVAAALPAPYRWAVAALADPEADPGDDPLDRLFRRIAAAGPPAEVARAGDAGERPPARPNPRALGAAHHP